MEFGLGSYGFGFLAGLFSTLSPCVLPVIPILLSSATNAHPRAPLALAGGLALSYAIIGTALAWAGSALGLDTSIFRGIGAAILGLIGLVLISGSLQQRFAAATSGIGDAGNSLITQMPLDGLWGQFAIGLVLGVVWSPCVGPTLGAAVALASQGSQVSKVALLMGIFGLGAALPVIMLTYVSRGAMLKMRGKLMQAHASSCKLMQAHASWKSWQNNLGCNHDRTVPTDIDRIRQAFGSGFGGALTRLAHTPDDPVLTVADRPLHRRKKLP